MRTNASQNIRADLRDISQRDRCELMVRVDGDGQLPFSLRLLRVQEQILGVESCSDDARRVTGVASGRVGLGLHSERLEVDELAQAGLFVAFGVVCTRRREEYEIGDALSFLGGFEEGLRDFGFVLEMGAT